MWLICILNLKSAEEKILTRQRMSHTNELDAKWNWFVLWIGNGIRLKKKRRMNIPLYKNI